MDFLRSKLRIPLKPCLLLIVSFFHFLLRYFRRKIVFWSLFFEQNKNLLVKFFLMKRGRYNRPFLHITAMLVMGIGVGIAPFLTETFPVFSSENSLQTIAFSDGEQSITASENVFQTNVSSKNQDKVITYTVQKGDTLSTIAQKFSSPDNIITTDTVRWANDLTNDDLSVGDELKILPVAGIAHKVQRGDTVYSIAKKYDAEPQAIADFTGNDFVNPETFSLVEGQILVVPGGVKPEDRPAAPRREVYIAHGPIPVAGGGFTWPVYGAVSQFASWYHMALDITSPIGAPLVAAHSGTVTKVSVGTWDGGYGTSVAINNGAGIESQYAHLSGVNVSVGQVVTGGQTVIGWIGMTGRTTGPHVHFEIRKNGFLVNPLAYLQ